MASRHCRWREEASHEGMKKRRPSLGLATKTSNHERPTPHRRVRREVRPHNCKCLFLRFLSLSLPLAPGKDVARRIVRGHTWVGERCMQMCVYEFC